MNDPERERHAQETAIQKTALRNGRKAAEDSLTDIGKITDPDKRELAMERALKNILGDAASGMSLAQLASLSTEELNAMLQKKQQGMENRKKVLTTIGRMLGTFATRDKDGKIIIFKELFDKLGKIISSTDVTKLRKELGTMPKEKREELLMVFQHFIPLALSRLEPDYAMAYATFIARLFTDKTYLNINSEGTQSKSRFEQDLISFAQATGPEVIQTVFRPMLASALDEIDRTPSSPIKSIAGITTIEMLDNRLTELLPAMEISVPDAVTTRPDGSGMNLAEMVGAEKGLQSQSFESQRIAKLRSDVGEQLLTSLESLMPGNTTLTIAGQQYTKEYFMDNVARFEPQFAARWAQMSVLLEVHLAQLEAISRTGGEGRKVTQEIAQVRRIIAVRNAYDFILHSGNVTGQFIPFYQRHFLLEVARVKARGNPGAIDITTSSYADYDGFTEAEKREVTTRATSAIRQSVNFMVSNIYRNYFNVIEEPRQPYREALEQGGDYTLNPTAMFTQLKNMISNLEYQARAVDAQRLGIDFSVTAYDQVQTVYNPKLERDTTIHNSLRRQKRGASAHDFLQELREQVIGEDEFFAAGHEFRMITHTGALEDRMFFQSVDKLLRHLMTGRNIDRIYSMEDAVFLTRTISFLETILKKRMGERGWITADEKGLYQEIFLSKGDGQRTLILQVKEFLEEHYPQLPDWQRQRIMQHAFTMVFAARFRFQQTMSFALPAAGYQGPSQEDVPNTHFQPFYKGFKYAADRWDHDFWLRGAYWQPLRNMPGYNQKGKWDPFELGEEGHSVYKTGKHERLGRLAWDLTEHFQDDMPEAFAPVNRLKVGGYDTLRGWRRNASMGVVDKVLLNPGIRGDMAKFRAEYDVRSPDGTVTHHIDGITRVWKSIENIGVNDVQAFVDGDITGMIKCDEAGTILNEAAVHHFVGHLYDRYLSDTHEFGKHLTHNYLFADMNRGMFSRKDPLKTMYTNLNLYGPDARRVRSRDEFVRLFDERLKQIYAEARGGGEISRAQAAGKEATRTLLKPMLYDAQMVMVAERSPLEFLYRLQGWNEQNGLRLDSQLKARYFNNARGSFMQSLRKQTEIQPESKLAKHFTSTDPTLAQKAKDSTWDEMTDDLAFAQGELRGEVDEEILANRARWEEATGGGNIFGDWSRERSLVNGGFGYAMDDATLVRIMLKKYNMGLSQQIRDGSLSWQGALQALSASGAHQDRVAALRIERVVSLRQDIIAQMGETPDVRKGDDAEEKLIANYLDPQGQPKEGLDKEGRQIAERLARNRTKRVNRARWVRRMWDEGFLGSIPFMADNSEIHKVFLNADNVMVARSTGECSVAEEYKLILDARAPESGTTNMLLMVKDAARKGTPESWGKLKSLITNFRKRSSDEVGESEIYMPVVLGLIKLQLSGLANKQEVRGALGKWGMMFGNPAGRSLFSEAYTWFEHHGMDSVTIRQYLLQFCKVNGINPDTMNDFNEFFQASWFHVAKDIIPEYLTYILAYALISYVTSSIKEGKDSK